MVTIDDLLTYTNRQTKILRNLYHIKDTDRFSEITLVGCWHRNNLEMKDKLCNDMYAKDVYLQQIMLMSSYHQYRLSNKVVKKNDDDVLYARI